MYITEEARSALQNLFDQYEASNIRIFLEEQSREPEQLGFSLDMPHAHDAIQTINEIKVAIDPRILFLTEDLTIDVQDTPQGRGIVII
jgi:Fe-S cluster assembly iron-binding protein IscA